jgi:hypothetical protein
MKPLSLQARAVTLALVLAVGCGGRAIRNTGGDGIDFEGSDPRLPEAPHSSIGVLEAA